MKLERRRFLSVSCASLCLSGLGAYSPTVEAFTTKPTTNDLEDNAPPGTALLYSAGKKRDGTYHLFCIHGEKTQAVAQLPGRAHEVLCHPAQNHLIVIARRPETLILVINKDTYEILHRLSSDKHSHFFGHGVFDNAARYLITTENNIRTGEGLIVLRDSSNNYRTHKRFASYGIGPHQIALMPHHDTVVVANGGILTRPNTGREKLNLDSMRPNLSYIDLFSGQLIEQVALPPSLHQLSIRHIDINAAGDVAIAMQYQGDTLDHVPLVMTHQRSEALRSVDIPPFILAKMKHYCGSICFDKSGHYLAVSAPRGDRVIFIDHTKRRYLNGCRIPDGCGLSSGSEGIFQISSGRGKLYYYAIDTANLHHTVNATPISYDNHLLALS